MASLLFVGLTDGSVCPTLVRKALRLCGAGAFACQPIFSRSLTLAAQCGAPFRAATARERLRNHL
jgi:hypothetical protein